MTIDAWPALLSAAPDIGWQISAAASKSDRSVSGIVRRNRTDGGGLWTVTLPGIWLYTPDMIRTARVMDRSMDGGATPVIVNTEERNFAPRPGGIGFDMGVPFGDGSSFSDGSEFESGATDITANANALLRATALQVRIKTGVAMRGGEAFSIYHAPPVGYETETGKRRYEVVRADSAVDAGDGTGNLLQAVTIRTPLRAAVTAGTRLDFDCVGAVMWLDNADQYFQALHLNQTGTISPVFVEAD